MNSRLLSWIPLFIVVLLLASCAPIPEQPPSDVSTPAVNQDTSGESQEADAPTETLSSDDQAAPAAEPIDAAALYVANGCSGCHGADRRGVNAPALLPDELTLPAADYVSIITNGKGRMPSFGNKLSPEQIEAIVAWLQTPLE